VKKEKNTNNILTFVGIIIFIIMIFVAISIDIKENNKNLRLEKEQEAELTRQENLSNCISQAKSDRNDLWNNNCTKQSDGSCTIRNNTGTIDWIEQRYEQDLDSCYELYGN